MDLVESGRSSPDKELLFGARAYILRYYLPRMIMPREFMEKKEYRQFEIMRDIALAGASGRKPQETAEAALKGAMNLVGLSAGMLAIWDESFTPILTVTHSETLQEREALMQLEEELFLNLRRKRHLVSAYLSFGGERPLATFTLPLRKGEKILGAVLGVQPGSGTLVGEGEFLEALAAALSLTMIAGGAVEPKATDIAAQIRKERLDAITEIATTIAHEINNPLTAVLGNVQLLLMKRNDLDDELKKKLKVIEESALRIKDVTQKLITITQERVTEYINGTKMIDLTDEEKAP
jgi:signal transduction histidine kinase